MPEQTVSDYEVIVAGGGPSGVMAAIAAAREGARTLLVERQGSLGGALSSMGVAPMMTFHAWGTQPIRGLAQTLVDRLVAADASPGHVIDTCGYVETVTPFDAEGLRLVLDEMAAESGAEALLHTLITGVRMDHGRMTGVEAHHKGGTLAFTAKMFVDATGDADLAVLSGCRVMRGREKDGLCQPMTKSFQLGQVDMAAIRSRIREHPENFRLPEGGEPSIRSVPRLSVCGFYEELEKAKAAGDFTVPRETVLFFEMHRPGFVNVNISRIPGGDVADPFTMSRAEREGRRQMNEIFRFLRKYVPGFANAVLLPAADRMGVRESRRIVGDYVVTADDLVKETVFPDAVAASGYPIDIHSPDGKGNTDIHLRKGGVYTVPYRALLAKSPDNLLVCGRALSATHEAAGALRVTPTCMATGEAAGMAAAMALKSGEDARKVEVPALQRRLRECGAFIPEL